MTDSGLLGTANWASNELLAASNELLMQSFLLFVLSENLFYNVHRGHVTQVSGIWEKYEYE